MIRKEKHIEIRHRVLEQLDEMLRLLKTGDGFPRRSQSDNRPIPKEDSRSRWPEFSFQFPLRHCWCAPYARQAPYRRPKINDNDHGVRMLASRSLRPPRYDPPQARRKTSLRKQIKSDALETFWPRLLYKARPSLDGCYILLSVIKLS